MKKTGKIIIEVQANVNVPIGVAWKYWTSPKDIVKWNNASDDWHTPRAENDLRAGGAFNYRMEAKDGSFGFDFEGVYDKVDINKRIDYTIGDGRKVNIVFFSQENQTTVVETFEAEHTHPVEIQRGGWQAILDNFKKYAEVNYQKKTK